MNRLDSLVNGQPVFIVDLGRRAFFDQSVGDTAVVYDANDSWYTVSIDNLAVLH